MAQGTNIAEIKRKMEHLVGEKIKLKANKGRKRVIVKEGVLENTYPSLFVVRIKDKYDSERIVSYTYTDILTRTVQIMPCGEESKIQVC